MFAPVFLYTLLRTVQTARARQFELHRKWAVLHSIAGYGVAINRVVLTFVLIAGYGLAALPDRVQQEWLKLPQSLPKIAEVEMSAFAGGAFYAFVVAGIWATNEYRKINTVVRKIAQ